MSTEAKIPSSSEKASSLGIGCGNIIGISLICMGIAFLLIPFIGIPLIIMGIFALVSTNAASKKVFKCSCPHCGNSYIVNVSAKTYFDCPKCSERVIYSERKFYTQEEFKNKNVR